jgi:hypothetical protein
MNILKEYRTYLLQKKPQSQPVQYFWLVVSAAIIVAVVFTLSAGTFLRSLLMISIYISLLVDAVTNLSYYRNRELFERLVYVKIAANIICLLFIIVFLVLSAKFSPR